MGVVVEEMELRGRCNRGIEVLCRDWVRKDGREVVMEE